MKAKTIGVKNARLPDGYVAKAAEGKKKVFEVLVKNFNSYSVVALVNLENLPAAQLQRLRLSLGNDLQIVMCKKTVMKLAIEAVKSKLPGIEQLASSFTGMPALLFTNQSPFKLAALLQKSKSKAPAKPGQTAPYDIVIPAGPTSFAPGPIISELAAVGIKAGVEGGKIAVKVPSTIVREGEKIKPKVAEVMAKFSIQPMEIGLNLVAAFENGMIYAKNVLSIMPEDYVAMIKAAASESLALSISIAYPAKDNIRQLIAKVYGTAKNFALQQKVMAAEAVEEEENAAAKLEVKTDAAAAVAETKEEVKKTVVGAAEKISEEFKEEIAAEKQRRDNVSHEKAEELAEGLKKKGTLRQ